MWESYQKVCHKMMKDSFLGFDNFIKNTKRIAMA